MKRTRKLTKRERQAVERGAVPPEDQSVVTCVVCDRPMGEKDFADETRGVVISCGHGSKYAACAGCDVEARHMVHRHDRTGRPVRSFRPVSS